MKTILPLPPGKQAHVVVLVDAYFLVRVALSRTEIESDQSQETCLHGGTHENKGTKARTF